VIVEHLITFSRGRFEWPALVEAQHYVSFILHVGYYFFYPGKKLLCDLPRIAITSAPSWTSHIDIFIDAAGVEIGFTLYAIGMSYCCGLQERPEVRKSGVVAVRKASSTY